MMGNERLSRLYTILQETTYQYRKGPEIVTKEESGLQVTEVYAMPAQGDAPTDLTLVDMGFLMIGVNPETAQRHKAEFIDILDHYPATERLVGGPSYIELGGVLGSQGVALQFMALGKALDLWGIMTPETLGITGDDARELMGAGLLYMTGYTKKEE